MYLTNRNPTGNIKFGIGGRHGAASEKMTLTSTGDLELNGNITADHLKLGESNNVGGNWVRYFKIGYFTLPSQYRDGQAIVEVLTRHGGNHTVHVNIERGSNQIDNIRTFFVKGSTYAETYYLYRTSANVAELWVKSTQAYDTLQIGIRNHSSDFTPDVSSAQANAPASETSWSPDGYFFNDGNLGIGTDTPSAKLDVNGDIKATGDVEAFTSSDKRFKDNILNIQNPVDKINKIGGYNYEWNDKSDKETGKKDIGVIAQEIEKVLPELVQTRENGYKAVKYDKIVALLIEGMKEQDLRIKELENKIK
jgi:hypothetical protein